MGATNPEAVLVGDIGKGTAEVAMRVALPALGEVGIAVITGGGARTSGVPENGITGLPTLTVDGSARGELTTVVPWFP